MITKVTDAPWDYPTEERAPSEKMDQDELAHLSNDCRTIHIGCYFYLAL